MKEGTTHYPLESEIFDLHSAGNIAKCRIMSPVDGNKTITVTLSDTGLSVKKGDAETWNILRHYLLVYFEVGFNHETKAWDYDIWVVPNDT